MRESGVFDRLAAANKLAIVDRGFRSKHKAERDCGAYPDFMDDKDLYSFKSRGRCRQETFNRRLTHFEALSKTFRHGHEKHRLVFEAIIVTVQYQMDNGKKLFDI